MTPDPDYTRPVSPGTFSFDPALAAAFGPDHTPGGFTLPPLLRDDPSELASVVQPSSAEMPKAGSQRYQLHGEIARGGMGVVLKGRDPDIGRDLAFKVLRGELAHKPAAVQRFVEEAQIGGQLQHPGVVPVYDLGRFADGRPYFAMKLVKGRTLADLFAARKSPADDRGRMLHVFLQVCQTVAYAHAKGVIHRDLKPSNVMVGGFGEVLVMDWGLAKVLPRGGIADEERANRGRQPVGASLEEPTVIHTARSGSGSGSDTQAGSVMGTPAFMPPEQAGGEIDKLDERADVFGLGAMLCVLLTGHPPYVAATGDEVRLMAVRGKLADAHARLDACGADPELVALCKRCLSAEREDRPRNADAVATAIQHYLSGVEERVRKAEVDRAAAEARAEEEVKTRKMAEAKAVAERKRRLTQLALLATVAVVGVSVLGGVLWLRGERLAKQARARQLVETHLERAETELVAERVKEASAALALAEPHLAEADSPELADRYAADVKDRDMVKELEAIFEEHWKLRTEPYLSAFAAEKTSDRYISAFREYGLSVGERKPQEIADAIRRTRISTALVAGLNHWYFLDESRPGLFETITHADPDPARNAIRKTVSEKGELSGIQGKLDELVASVNWATAPVWFAVGLNSTDAMRQETALRIMKEAWYAHPDSYALARRIGDWQIRFDGDSIRDNTEAISWFRTAIALRPDDASSHNFLGTALFQTKASPVETLIACRTALRLDPRHTDSRACLIHTLRRMKDWDNMVIEYRESFNRRRRPSVASGEDFDITTGYGDGLMDGFEDQVVPTLCKEGRPHLAIRFAREFRVGESQSNTETQADGDSIFSPARYNAACAAMLCAIGKGTDCPPPSERPALRREASGYLKLDLAMWRKGFTTNPDKHRNEVHNTIHHWLRDADLTPVREQEGLATLPQVEQAEWQSFWAEVRKLHADSKPEVLPPPREDK